MTKKLSPRAGSRRLLEAILHESKLVAEVRALEPRVLGQLIDHVGLEDAGELIALATTEQLEKVFSEDLWRNARPGQEETFDADRFATWLEVLLEMGPDFTADRIAEMDPDFMTMALSRLILVVDLDELAMKMSQGQDDEDALLDKVLESGLNQELDNFLLLSRNDRAWDAVVSALASLDERHHSFCDRLLRRCLAATESLIEDHDGLFNALTADEQIVADAAASREEAREEEGFVSPANAAAFLKQARATALADLLRAAEPDHLTRSYFKSLEARAALARHPSARGTSRTDKDMDPSSAGDPSRTAGAARILGLLRIAGVMPSAPAGPALGGSTARTDESPLRRGLAELAGLDPQAHERRMKELAYLANVLMAGCGLEERRFRPFEAAEAAMATAELGLERWLALEPAEGQLGEVLRTNDVVRMFRAGWNILGTEIGAFAADRLLEALAERSTRGTASDPWLEKQLAALRTTVMRARGEGKPWAARPKLGLLTALLDQRRMRLLQDALSECPVLHGTDDGPGADKERGGPLAFVNNRARLLEMQKNLEDVWNALVSAPGPDRS